MKKKILFGVVAVALIAMNVFAFSSAALPPSPYPPGFHDSGCYQTMGRCGRFYREVCTSLYTNSQCKQYYCSDCAIHQEPIIHSDLDDLLPKINF